MAPKLVAAIGSLQALQGYNVPRLLCVWWKYIAQQLYTASCLCCVPSAVCWVRLWVWHRVSPSGSAVLWHQCQAHRGSANTVEGELARSLVWVGYCSSGNALARTALFLLLIYHMGTKKAYELKVRGAGRRGNPSILNLTCETSM